MPVLCVHYAVAALIFDPSISLANISQTQISWKKICWPACFIFPQHFLSQWTAHVGSSLSHVYSDLTKCRGKYMEEELDTLGVSVTGNLRGNVGVSLR